MWSDDEAEVDLLGFEYLVDELVTALTSPALLPLTVGVLGEWGSGKSSLLKIAKRELDDLTDPGFVTVHFSPWQYEGYEDVKLALMSRVLDECELKGADSNRVRGLKSFVTKMGKIGRKVGRVAARTIPSAAGTIASAIDPTVFEPALTQAVTTSVGASAAALLDELPEDDNQAVAVATLSDFRVKFGEMVAGLSAQAVVVFIDDLDRCLPNTVVETFEAIRLFLNTPRTAFVIAAHRQIAEAAVDAAFPDYGKVSGPGLGHEYLEKMLQLQLEVPRLSLDDSAAYVGLLFARLRLGDDAFNKLSSNVSDRRRNSPLARAFDLSIAADVLGDDLTPELKSDLEWAEDILPAIAAALRGNPRQTKRFLNDIQLRQQAAKRRNVSLEPGILAKLMVLSETDFDAFQTLFDWQLSAEGPIDELRAAEQPRKTLSTKSELLTVADTDELGAKRAGKKTPEEHSELSTIIAQWAARPAVARWLGIAPNLGEKDLRPYFTYFRSNLSISSLTASLPQSLQLLLQQLTSGVTAVRRNASEALVELNQDQQDDLFEVLISNIRQRPDGASWDAAVEIAGKSDRLGNAFIATLMTMNDRLVPAGRALGLLSRLPKGDARDALIAKWKGSDVTQLATVASAADRAGKH